MQCTAGCLLSAATVCFSTYFPFFLAPFAARQTYHYAIFEYNPNTSSFDNSPLTYGTDYGLALCMGILIRSISCSCPTNSALVWRSRGLFACYLLSVLAGGLAHQFYTSLEQRNTLHFRILWTVCVGAVAFASAFMGAIGSELVSRDEERGLVSKYLPFFRERFWVAFGVFSTSICAGGGLSFQRPACDIFVAGTTQFPSTLFIVAIFVLGLPTHPVPKRTRVLGALGFVLNAPLLPMYPLLVQYTSWSLASVNSFLHAWLLVAWSLQGIALRRVEQALAQDATPPPCAVPLKRSHKMD